LSRSADCQNACNAPPNACCPQRCQRNGIAECCPHSGTCCGGRCCPSGQQCADAGHDLCCPPNSGPPCGTFCCQPGSKCANLTRGFCCPQNAGQYCPKVWDEEHWTDSCCPPGEVCVDPSTGLCCPRDHGPACGERCCKAGEVCRDGQCCDPRFLCGHGERATCCIGVCRDGQCCHSPMHMCGDVCCPPFNPCCQYEGRRVCCGAYEQCTTRGCCPRERVCGRTCCPPGHVCEDPDSEACIPCPADLAPCLPWEPEARGRGICCLPNVSCCTGRCCAPGEMCCTPYGHPADEPPDCHPASACVYPLH
jgi:hypothetical protein